VNFSQVIDSVFFIFFSSLSFFIPLEGEKDHTIKKKREAMLPSSSGVAVPHPLLILEV